MRPGVWGTLGGLEGLRVSVVRRRMWFGVDGMRAATRRFERLYLPSSGGIQWEAKSICILLGWVRGYHAIDCNMLWCQY